MESEQGGHELPIGEAIFLVRRYRKMSQIELAERSGVHRNSIVEIERGSRHPGFAALTKLAGALDLKLSRLIKEAEGIKPAL